MGVYSRKIYCYSSLLSTFQDIFQLLESGADVSLVFFDLRKAFDTIPQLLLLQKLSDCGLDQHSPVDNNVMLSS